MNINSRPGLEAWRVPPYCPQGGHSPDLGIECVLHVTVGFLGHPGHIPLGQTEAGGEDASGKKISWHLNNATQPLTHTRLSL